MVLIKAKDADGKVRRTCDARCYNAKGKECHCVCGGLNHGKGLANAKELTEANRDEITHAHEQEYPDLEVIFEEDD